MKETFKTKFGSGPRTIIKKIATDGPDSFKSLSEKFGAISGRAKISRAHFSEITVFPGIIASPTVSDDELHDMIDTFISMEVGTTPRYFFPLDIFGGLLTQKIGLFPMSRLRKNILRFLAEAIAERETTDDAVALADAIAVVLSKTRTDYQLANIFVSMAASSSEKETDIHSYRNIFKDFKAYLPKQMECSSIRKIGEEVYICCQMFGVDPDSLREMAALAYMMECPCAFGQLDRTGEEDPFEGVFSLPADKFLLAHDEFEEISKDESGQRRGLLLEIDETTEISDDMWALILRPTETDAEACYEDAERSSYQSTSRGEACLALSLKDKSPVLEFFSIVSKKSGFLDHNDIGRALDLFWSFSAFSKHMLKNYILTMANVSSRAGVIIDGFFKDKGISGIVAYDEITASEEDFIGISFEKTSVSIN